MNNKEKIITELNDFCSNIEKWFRGETQNQEIVLKKILSGFSPEFIMINGDGNHVNLAMLSEWLPTVFGKFPERSVRMEDLEIHHSGHHGLATYTEIQTTEGIANKRQSSAVFVLTEEKALWFHLVENWI